MNVNARNGAYPGGKAAADCLRRVRRTAGFASATGRVIARPGAAGERPIPTPSSGVFVNLGIAYLYRAGLLTREYTASITLLALDQEIRVELGSSIPKEPAETAPTPEHYTLKNLKKI
jgi:hypothetical protein